MDAVIAGPARQPMAVERDGTLGLALLLVLAVIGFEQFLHTSPAAQSGSPAYEILYWLSDALLALPFAVLAVWGGGRIAERLGLGLFGGAGLIALLFAIALIPGWFLHDDVDRWAHTVAQTGGHSHGGGHASHDDEVHWAGDTVFRALILVTLASAAVWGGDLIGRRVSRGRARRSSLPVRAGVIAVLLAVALATAWWLEVGADRADPAGQVTYANAYIPGHIRRPVAHSHGSGPVHIHLAAVSVADVSPGPPLGYRVAHALRDGLAGQAVGLPVLVLALLWLRRRRTPLGSTPRWANS